MYMCADVCDWDIERRSINKKLLKTFESCQLFQKINLKYTSIKLEL